MLEKLFAFWWRLVLFIRGGYLYPPPAYLCPAATELSSAPMLLCIYLLRESLCLKTARQSLALLAPRRSHFTSPSLELCNQERGFFFPPSTVRLDFSLVHFINTELNTCYMLNIPAE